MKIDLTSFLSLFFPDQKITMLGYPLPTDVFPTSEGECPGSAPAIMDNLNGAIEDACKEVGATYIDERFIGGASTAGASWSPGSLHADPVHLNTKGCKVCRAIHALAHATDDALWLLVHIRVHIHVTPVHTYTQYTTHRHCTTPPRTT